MPLYTGDDFAVAPTAPAPKPKKSSGGVNGWLDFSNLQGMMPPAPGSPEAITYGTPGHQQGDPGVLGPPIPQPPMPNATGQYGSMGGGGGDYGGGGPGGMPSPTPVIPSTGDWLTKDAIFQALQNRLQRSVEEFTANKGRQDNLIDTNASQQHTDLGQSQEQGAGDLLSRAAASGALLGNTGYAGLVNNMNQDFGRRNSMVDTNAGTAHQSLTDALAQLRGSNQDMLDQGRADSLARRLAKYNI